MTVFPSEGGTFTQAKDKAMPVLDISRPKTIEIFNALSRVVVPHMTDSGAYYSDLLADTAFALRILDGKERVAFSYAVSRTGTYTSTSAEKALWVKSIKETVREPKFYTVTLYLSRVGTLTVKIEED